MQRTCSGGLGRGGQNTEGEQAHDA
jgi:hypothetical protein